MKDIGKMLRISRQEASDLIKKLLCDGDRDEFVDQIRQPQI
jgi:DNA-binding Lrp family transcriptional regulator